ncbi:MAG TPA: YggS family pyridoxal phosphate-dependent enzyme [Treponema sp.]|nr:YggS family pyridoxal phosphate-dependent enzyme [Treponema sp.]
MSVRDNVSRIEERIQRACDRAGRNREAIRLMAVSKFQSLESIKEAYEAGIRLFGESRVQEARAKFGFTTTGLADMELHCIGQLQRNKVKNALELFSCIQSVDRNELILELARQCERESNTIDILLELHTGESSKTGYPDVDRLTEAVELALSYPLLHLRGLMTMAPYTDDSRLIRQSFRQLAEAQRTLIQRFPGIDMGVLSMGMSNDFEIAIEEGSTLLRIGTALFKGDAS